MSDTRPPNPIGADAQLVDLAHDRRLELGQARIRIDVVERAEQLLLRLHVTRRAIAADRHPNRPRSAALALRVPHRVQDALPDPLERAIGAAEIRQFRRQRVLRVHVLAAAALQDQLHLDLVVVLPLVEVDDRGAGPEVRSVFSPVIESTEFGRSLPRFVASATASRICFFITIWLAPTGVATSNVGMPVSWQIAPSPSAARSMFCAMIASAWPDCVPACSCAIATFIAERTSGGRSVEVRTMSETTLSKNPGNIRSV
jgi:hypothetical protein